MQIKRQLHIQTHAHFVAFANPEAAASFALLDNGVLSPVLDRFEVLGTVQRDARSAFFLAQRIAHKRDWVHRELVVNVLSLDGDDAPRGILLALLILEARGGVLLADLLTAVEDDIQVLGHSRRHAVRWEPAHEDWQLMLSTRLVVGEQQAGVGLRDRQLVHARVGEVLHEEVLAERGVTVDELAISLAEDLVNLLLEFGLVVLDLRAVVLRVVELAEAEAIEHDLVRRLLLLRVDARVGGLLLLSCEARHDTRDAADSSARWGVDGRVDEAHAREQHVRAERAECGDSVARSVELQLQISPT